MPAAKPAPRVHDHLEALRAAGLDTQAFFEALVAIRDDSALPAAHREALYKCVAMESYAWYLEALLGEPIDRVKAMVEARAIAEGEASRPAIEKTKPGASSAELLARDLRRGGPPPGAPAAPRDRRPGPGPRRPKPAEGAPKPSSGPRKPKPPGGE